MNTDQADFSLFIQQFGFIIFFLVMVFAGTLIVGDQVTTVFLWLVLAGMVLTNTDKITALLGRYSTV